MNETQRNDFIALLIWIAGERIKSLLGLSSEWNQETWCEQPVCGTKSCIAGRYMLTHGWEPIFRYGGRDTKYLSHWSKTSDEDFVSLRVDGHETGSYVAAQLGIHDGSETGNAVFGGDEDFDTIVEKARQILNPEPEPLADWERELLHGNPWEDHNHEEPPF